VNFQQIIKKLKSLSNLKAVEGMARFGISSDKTLGISMPVLRKLGKKIGKNHQLAIKLWDSGYHEAKILASIVAEIDKLDEKTMDKWIKGFDSWDVCDQVMMNLFYKSPIAYRKAMEWCDLKPEFERRAGFALMAVLGWKDKKADDKKFDQFIPAILKYATDNRNYVKKAVNWAIRQIGKRACHSEQGRGMNKKFIQVAEEVAKLNNKTAKWIAGDALRELKSEAVQKRLS